jgi:hypothetical protein
MTFRRIAPRAVGRMEVSRTRGTKDGVAARGSTSTTSSMSSRSTTEMQCKSCSAKKSCHFIGNNIHHGSRFAVCFLGYTWDVTVCRKFRLPMGLHSARWGDQARNLLLPPARLISMTAIHKFPVPFHIINLIIPEERISLFVFPPPSLSLRGPT